MYGHLPAIRDCDGLDLYAIYDPNAGQLEAARSAFDVPLAFTDADNFFKSGIEAVTITSPAPYHVSNVLDAAAHALPVLCEKPLAMEPAEAELMIAAMDRVGAPLYTAFCYRFSASALRIKELVQTKAIGEVRALRLIYNWDVHGKYEMDQWGQRVLQARREGRMLEGGPMVDCGTHQIDLAHFWLDSPVVQFDGHGAWVDDHVAPDHMWLHMDHQSGAHTMVEISYSYHHTTGGKRNEFVYELIGTEGVIRYDRSECTFTLDNADGTQVLPFHHEKDFLGMYADYARTLEGHPTNLTSARDGMRVLETARQATDQAIAKRMK